MAARLSRALTDAATYPGALDRKALCIIPGASVWVAHVDALVLAYGGGSLYDAVALCAKAAIHACTLPNWSLLRDEAGKAVDFELTDDPFDLRPLGGSGFPVVVTLTKVAAHCVVDASLREEACADGRIVVGVSPSGAITSVTKLGARGVHPELMLEMLQQGRDAGRALLEELEKALGEEAAKGEDRKIVGFL